MRLPEIRSSLKPLLKPKLKPIHLLHLTDRALAWATLRAEGSGALGLLAWNVAETGRLEGRPAERLDRWAEQRGGDFGDVILYDGRPVYFSFSARIPAKARKQRDEILRLKVRQELGLGEQEVYWCSRPEPAPGAPGMIDLFTVVTRRESLADVLDWRARRAVGSLWVGPDIGAIRALVARGMAPSHSVIIDSDDRGATLYHANGASQIARSRADLNGRRHDPPPDEWPDAQWRSHFGAADSARLLEAMPTLGALPAATRDSPARRRSGVLTLPAPDAGSLDAVLSGALADLESGLYPPRLHPRPAMDSFVRGLKAPIRLLERADEIPWRRAGGAAAAAAAALALSVWGAAKVREGARIEAVKQANTLSSRTRVYQSQEGVLRRIKADRAPMMPILEAILRAAPEGMTLNSFSVSATGVIQIDGTAQAPNAANDFFSAVSGNKLFEKVQLQDMKAGGGKSGFTFQLTASVKGRAKR